MRIGHGYDVHRLVPDRKLILGGVTIPYALGLLGHSDADVVTHAAMDAILGALGQGDIGQHFPDTDDDFRGIDSMLLADRIWQILNHSGQHLVNMDITILAQKPRLMAYLPEMAEKLAAVFHTEKANINVKATTEEGLGFTGAGLGIAVHAVCLIDNMKMTK